MVDITILYCFLVSKNKTTLQYLLVKHILFKTTDSTYYIWLLHLDIKSEFWHPYIIMIAYITIPTPFKFSLSKTTGIIKAASSDGRDLAPGTANRWLQNDREQ